MTRARILADYVAGGATAAEFDYLDGVTSNIQTQFTAKAPLASPAFTGTPTGITAAHLEAGVLPSDVTGGSGLTALGTVTAGDISHADIVYPNGHIITHSAVVTANATSQVDTDQDAFTPISGIECSLTTKLAGANSKIVIVAHSGHVHTSDSSGGSTTIISSQSTGASYSTGADLMYTGTGTWAGAACSTDTTTIHIAQTCIMTQSDHVADDEYFFRICIKRGAASGTFRWCHSGSYYTFYAYEVKI